MSDFEKINGISIGVTTFNRIYFLRDAIRSIENQEIENYEILIGNDFIDKPILLTDINSKNVKKIQIFNHKKNLGEFANMNYLLNKSSKKWFIWLSDDDLFHPKLFNKLISMIKLYNGNELVGIFSNYISFYKKNNIKKNYNKKIFNTIFGKNEFLIKYSKKNIKMIGCYGLIQSNILKKIKGIKKLGNSFGPYSDTLLPVILSNFGKIAYTTEELIQFRKHPESKSYFAFDYMTYVEAENDFINILKNEIEESYFKNKVILNFNLWFAENNLFIINKNNGVFNSLKIFFTYIKNISFPRLILFNKIVYIFIIIKIIFKILIYSNILKIIKK